MARTEIKSITVHASERLAQRNLTPDDVHYVCAHGRQLHNGSAVFVHLGLRDIPLQDRKEDRRRRLEGTVLVLDAETGQSLTTAYRNRQHGIRDIKRKLKRSIQPI